MRRCVRACMMGILAILLCMQAACAAKEKPVERSDFLLDTYVIITIYDSDGDAAAILNGAMALCRAYEQQFSRTIAGSDISRINAANGQAVEVHVETAQVLEAAMDYSRASGGFFDVTVGGASALWNFTGENPVIPALESINEALDGVGYENIIIEGNTVRLASPRTRLDLGAIAKGYISDQIAAYLSAQGVRSAIVNLGGNVVTVGERRGGAPWGVGVQKPFAPDGVLAGILRVPGGAAVVSTGVYERCFMRDDVLYHHILDPQTGFPAASDLYAVTVITESGMAADAMGTIVFGLGAEAGLAYLENVPNAEGVLIGADGQIYTTSGIGGTIGFEPR